MRSTLFGRPSRPAPVRRARLSLESLDGRWAPSDSNPLDPPGTGGGPLIADMDPEIVDFTWAAPANRQITFTGRVIDEQAEGLVVTFSGFQTVNGKTATALSNGTFTLTINIPANAIGGAYGVMATTVDRAGHESNLAYTTVNF